MNKKIIALAVAAAVTAPVAMADVTLYGRAHVDYRYTDNGTTDVWTVNSNASRLGFKGTEDLGNGLQAIFKYEVSYDIDGDSTTNTSTNILHSHTASNAPFNGARNAYVGLKGEFGKLVIGRHDTPAKSAYYGSGNDHLSDSVIDLNANMGYSQDRWNNAVQYNSPNFSGLTFGASIQPGEGNGDEDGPGDSYSVGLVYKGHGVKAGAGYVRTADTMGNDDEKMFQLGASYTMGNITVGANYEDNSNYGTTADQDKNVWSLAAKAKFGNNALIANYGESETEAGGATTAETEAFGLALQHNLSKRTSVYAAYSQREENDVAMGGTTTDTDNFGIGVTHNF